MCSVPHGTFEIGIEVVVCKRKTNTWDIVKCRFDSSTHSSRVEDIHCCIGAMVDARNYQINFFVTEEVVESHFYAIYGCSVERVYRYILLVTYLAEV